MKHNFSTMLRAAKNGELALLSCIEKSTKQPVMAICAMQKEDDGSITPVPIAQMFQSNPYELLEDPTPHLNDCKANN
jgi:hypothetical protein